MFGHIDRLSAAGIGHEPAFIVLDHTDGHADEDGGLAVSHHCVQHSQCSFHAVLAGAATVDRHVSTRVGDLADQLGRDRTVPARRRPPIG
jgi:hypothetical protein